MGLGLDVLGISTQPPALSPQPCSSYARPFRAARAEHNRPATASPHAGLASTDDGVRAVSHLELTEDIRHVVAHSLGAEHETRGDLGVVGALRDEAQDLTLA